MGEDRQTIEAAEADESCATAENGLEPPTGGEAEPLPPRDDLIELRRENQRLGLALQLERARADRLEALVGEPVEGLDEFDDEDVTPPRWLPRLGTLGREATPGGPERWLGSLAGRREAAGVPWSSVRVWEIAALGLILTAAVLLRFWDVRTVPDGFQGDESAAGLLGQQIRAEGWIGPYTTQMAGSPTGFYYVVAPSMALIDDVILAIRVVPALFGVLGVLALYLVARRSFGVPAALTAALFLATLGWHIHYSRIAFPNIAWPFVVLLGLYALIEAVRSGDWRWWAGAGALFGLGVYTYNSHILVMAMVAAAVGFHLFGWVALAAPAAYVLYAERPGFLTLSLLALALIALLASERVQDRRRLIQAVAFGGAFVLVASSMIRYAADDAHDYFGYGRRLSIFNSDEWAVQTEPSDKVGFVVGRYRDYWDRLCCEPRFDGVDALGVTPVIPLVTLFLASIGIAFGFSRGHRIAASLGALVLLAMPLASALSVDFAIRRSLVVTVFVALFAGVGVVEGVRWAWRRGWAAGLPVTGLLLLLSLLSVYRNLDNFFGVTVESREMEWVLAGEMVAASQYVGTLGPESYVYFFSNRWPFSHEHRRFFAPNARGEDRSEEFGDYGFAIDPTAGRPVFLFIGSYLADVVEAEERYPGGQTIVAGDPEDPDYVVYLPPWGDDLPPPAPSEVVPVATPADDPATRG
jgi:4-amino-4-deoxy-L-arabinose transferase-like glycosyltransferase